MQKSKLGRLAAATLGMALVIASCGSDTKTPAGTTADSTGVSTADTTGAAAGVTCDGITIGYLGALSGDNGALGQNMVNGAQIAIDDFNAANPDCKVSLDKQDSQGDPAQATPLATTLANNASIIALIGPGFSGESKATMPTFETAGLPVISPSATNAKLTTNGWKMFHRILANDDKQAPGVVQLIKGTIKATKVGVIDDASDYGKGLADSVRTGLAELDIANATIDPKAADYSAAVTAMKDAGVDTIFYSGYYAEAAKMLTQLRDAGVTATFVSGDGSLDPAFITGAGAAADGAYLTATGAPPDVNADFAAKFNTAYGTVPGLYSPESYDCAQVILAAIAAGKVTRADMAAFIDAFDAPGITKPIKFDATGEPEGSAVFYTVVEAGKLVSKGLIP